mmetsp:Transcript_52429/g.157298  ORF Transcript_52429/g.157298 Transcript_52429/m.157298 type:complete len:253 (+) Transcript_52429:495-1253(+)
MLLPLRRRLDALARRKTRSKSGERCRPRTAATRATRGSATTTMTTMMTMTTMTIVSMRRTSFGAPKRRARALPTTRPTTTRSPLRWARRRCRGRRRRPATGFQPERCPKQSHRKSNGRQRLPVLMQKVQQRRGKLHQHATMLPLGSFFNVLATPRSRRESHRRRHCRLLTMMPKGQTAKIIVCGLEMTTTMTSSRSSIVLLLRSEGRRYCPTTSFRPRRIPPGKASCRRSGRKMQAAESRRTRGVEPRRRLR